MVCSLDGRVVLRESTAGDDVAALGAQVAQHLLDAGGRQLLDDLDPKQREAVEAVTRRVVAKLLHEPTVRLKDAAGSARGERLSEALRELFGIE